MFDDKITGEWWKSSLVQSSQTRLEPNILVDTADQKRAMISILEISEPRSYKDAKRSPQWPEWEKAFEEEMSSLHENNVWQLVTRPEGRNIVGGKWVCKVKGNAQGELDRFKARYVAKGFSQIQGLDFDETCQMSRYEVGSVRWSRDFAGEDGDKRYIVRESLRSRDKTTGSLGSIYQIRL